jgi:apolipoprotein N-acyltransferase
MIPSAMGTRLRTYAPAVLSGVLLALCFPRWHLFPLAWVALVPLLCRVHGLPARQAIRHFFVAGYVFNILLLQWLLSHFYWVGGVAFLGHQLLSIVMALYWAFLGWLWTWSRNKVQWAPPSVTFAFFWVTMEQLQAHLFTGFGWGALAYSQGPDLPFLQWAAVGGTALVGLILALTNGLIAQFIMERKGRVIRLVAAVAVLGGSHGFGTIMLGEPDYGWKPLQVGIVQTNYPLETKWDPEYWVDMVENSAAKSRALDARDPVDLFVWPESLVRGEVETPAYLAPIQEAISATGSAVFTGAQRSHEVTGLPMNSGSLINARGEVEGHYDKIHLAPFGEYVPFGKQFPILRRLVPVPNDLEAGAEPKVFETGGRRFGPLICFEVLFAPMSERLRQMDADMLVVITNLSWFGQSNAIAQELEIARVRAVETRLPLVHSANTGISGVFDPWGRFEHISTYVDHSGTLYKVPGDPENMIRHRLVGALPVAGPGMRTVPGGPHVFPWACVGLAAAFLIFALCIPRSRSDLVTAEPQFPPAQIP